LWYIYLYIIAYEEESDGGEFQEELGLSWEHFFSSYERYKSIYIIYKYRSI